MRFLKGGELTLSTLVVFNVIILVSVIIFGASLYLFSKLDVIRQSEQNQTQVSIQQRQIQVLQDNVTSLRKELGVQQNTATQEVTTLTQKLDQTQAQQQANATQTQQQLSALSAAAAKTYDTSAIVAEWRPRIAYVECDWTDNTGAVYQTESGSGVITQQTNGNPAVVTSAHLVVDPSGVPTSGCRVHVPDDPATTTVNVSQISRSSAGYDWARLDLSNTDQHLVTLAAQKFSVCATTPPIGTNIVIIGYPGIGTRNDITATEGIISGYDSDFFITSAKVERGNSGGAAIALQKDCYLGIPTFADVGSLESLARVLSAQFIFPTH
ncbi:trypsin-like peptidase domain-containing protein [Patescibacteria group bacterium]|nr:trypsin-like peptidase domain-containing protein [Patescibacteria group bacterium]